MRSNSVLLWTDLVMQHTMAFCGDAFQNQSQGMDGIRVMTLKRLSSAVAENELADCLQSVSCTTFNILAPVYKRINSESCRESQFREYWKKRNEEIVDMLLKKRSSIICLQEFWVRNRELVEMYERNLGNHGYEIYKLRRTNNHEDGLLTAVRKDHFKVLSSHELVLHGDRVAQVLHVKSVTPYRRCLTKCIQQDTLIVNTHLMFPHNSDICLLRLRQVYKILEYLETYQEENKLPPMPIILCGDWNGSKRGHVYKFLRSQGFLSSYDTAHRYTDNDADAHKWVSHRNHRGNICGVDFIWLLNPNNHRRPLKASWNDAVFGIIKSKLNEAGLKDTDAFCFFKSDDRNDGHVTISEFRDALQQLGLTEKCYEGLTAKEMEELFQAADADANGLIDFEDFQMMLNTFLDNSSPRHTYGEKEGTQARDMPFQLSESGNENSEFNSPRCLSTTLEFEGVFRRKTNERSTSALGLLEIDKKWDDQETTFGFDVEKAFLFPPEVEKGMWPDNYFLSDHATLTVVFTPVRLPRTPEDDY